MCRLYGIRATHPTRVACELLAAQNALIRQSERDDRGLDNPHGWGIGVVHHGRSTLRRQVGPADESADYRAHALEVSAETVIAHIRRATVGEPSEVNTHPFQHGQSLLAHNGHIGHFDTIRPLLRAALGPERAAAIAGSTDSEHFFHLVLAALDDSSSPLDALRRAADQVWAWGDALDVPHPLFLNTLMVHQGQLYGTRLDRTLWMLERTEALVCPICGERHAEPPAGEDYRAIVLASERITDEPWQRVPEASAFRVTGDIRFEARELFGTGAPLVVPDATPLAHYERALAPTLDEARAEVVRLHKAFEDWFSGARAKADDGLDDVERALDEDFSLVSPRGQVQSRGTVLEYLRATHGQAPVMRIRIRKVGLLHSSGDLVLVAYEEWQELAGAAPRGRQATALLARDAAAPGGFRWLHVHETWLAP